MIKQRDTNFWTDGTHVEWEIHPFIELMVGYEDERGRADGLNQPRFMEDIPFFNHYVAAELRVLVTDKNGCHLNDDAALVIPEI